MLLTNSLLLKLTEHNLDSRIHYTFKYCVNCLQEHLTTYMGQPLFLYVLYIQLLIPFSFSYAFMKIPTKHSMRAKRRRTHPLTPSPQQQSASRWPPTSPPPRTTTSQSSPLQPTLHPTLLEKLRLGSPSEHHMQWSAINRSSDGVAASRQLHELQSSAPFPKLPPYYCHSLLGDSEDSELVELDKEGKGLGEQETQIHKGTLPIYYILLLTIANNTWILNAYTVQLCTYIALYICEYDSHVSHHFSLPLHYKQVPLSPSQTCLKE